MSKKLLLYSCIVAASALFRVSTSHHPFWIDEFSSAQQAKLLNSYGLINFFSQTDYYAESNNILTHIIIAISFKLVGMSEFSARLPFMIIGSTVPLLTYLYAKKVFDRNIALSATLLTATSYFVITWSRQARGYALQQALLLGLLLAHYQIKKHGGGKNLYIFFLVALAGMLTHTLFSLFVVILIIDIAANLRSHLNKKMIMQLIIGTGIMIGMLWIVGIISQILKTAGTIQLHNNIWYYHALIWRHHALIAILVLLGTLHAIRHKLNQVYPILLVITSQIILVSIILAPYTSRYIATIFPLLLVLAAYAIVAFSGTIKLDRKIIGYRILPLLITGIIIANGDTFTVLPKPFYSVNHTMRDIALVDYDAVYAPVLDIAKRGISPALIDTWADRARWYTDETNASLYWLRWEEESSTINGLPMSTPYYFGDDNKKYVPLSGKPNLQLITTEADIKGIVSAHKVGFIWIDDTSLPQDVISYAEANLHKELYLDHYQYDDNPYSIWPGTLYSWGLD